MNEKNEEVFTRKIAEKVSKKHCIPMDKVLSALSIPLPFLKQEEIEEAKTAKEAEKIYCKSRSGSQEEAAAIRKIASFY